jgi:hypothetical protein
LYANGDIFVGNLKDGEKHGAGKLTIAKPSGFSKQKRFNQEWEKGKKIIEK